MLKFGTPTIAPPLAIKKCTVQTGCTVYIYIIRLWTKKIFLNRTSIAIDSAFQTFEVGFLVEFIDEFYYFFLQKRFPCCVNQGFPYLMRT